MTWSPLVIHMGKIHLDSSHYKPKINSRWILDLNVNCKVIALLEEATTDICDLEVDKNILNNMQKH